MPKFTEAQRVGMLAEQTFGAFVADRGWIWNPTAAGADFGIDGSVTLVDAAKVQPLEFRVQLKAVHQADTVDAGSAVSLPPIEVETWLLWQSHLLLTLVVLWDNSNHTFYYCWANDINCPAGMQRTHRARIPANSKLNSTSAQLIRTKVEVHHDSFRDLVSHTENTATFLTSYDRLSDYEDLCVEFMAFLGLREFIPIRALLNEDSVPSPQLAEYSISMPPNLVRKDMRSGIAAIVVNLTLEELQRLASLPPRSDEMEPHPIVAALSKIGNRVRQIEQRVNVTISQHTDSREGTPGRVVLQSVPDTYVAVVQLGLLLRDLLREMRRLFFPAPPPAKSSMPTLREIAARNVMSEDLWVRHSGRSIVREVFGKKQSREVSNLGLWNITLPI